MTDTLFDCPSCHEAREQAEAQAAELTWLRKRVASHDLNIKKGCCERCGGGCDIVGLAEKHGFALIFCANCWRPGDRFELRYRKGVVAEVVTWRQTVLHLPEGHVTIDLDGQGTKEWPNWAMSWRSSGVVEMQGGGGGVGCMPQGLRTVLLNLGQLGSR